MGILGTALTGLSAAQLGLQTTEHNIANVNTPGYSRQRTLQTTNSPTFTGSGFVGQGTRVVDIQRQYNAFLATQLNRTQSNTNELQKYAGEIASIDNMLADPSAGLSPALAEFFRGVQQVASDPSSLPARQSMVSAAQVLGARFQSISARLSEMYDGVDSQITSTVDGINATAAQIAELNQRIQVAGAGLLQQPNDLLDQRDQLVTDLSKLIRVQVVNDPSGAYNVFIGNGQQLVVGTTVNTLAVQQSTEDGSRTVVGLKTLSGTQVLPDSTFSGGDLGGLMRFRAEALDTTSNQLGQVAASLALTFNAQHALGQDLVGQIAGAAGFAADFFQPLTPATTSNGLNTGTGVASAGYLPPTAGSNGYFTQLTASDYRLVSDGLGAFTLTRLSDNKVWGPAALGPQTAPFTAGTLNSILADPTDPAYDPQGFTVAVAGAPAANDSFLIQPTRNAAKNIAVNASLAADPRLIAAAAPIRVQPATTNTGNAVVGPTSVAEGYSAASLPDTLTFSPPDVGHPVGSFPNGYLGGFPLGAVVTSTIGGVTSSFTIGAAAPADAIPYQSGAVISYNGLSFQITGKPSTGDQFVLERNTQGVADGRNMLLLGQLQTQNTMAGGTTTFQGGYAKLVSDIGTRAHANDVTLSAQQRLLEQSKAARESESGVNLDEEAANLIRFQQAYQAAAKTMQIAASLFDEILALGR